MQVNRLQRWLTPFKATAAGQSLCALEKLPEISNTAELQYNTKQLKAGDIFIALPGVGGHGNRFIRQALAQGAAVVTGFRADNQSGPCAGAGGRRQSIQKLSSCRC